MSSPPEESDSPTSGLSSKLKLLNEKAEGLISKKQYSSAIASLTEGLKLATVPDDKAPLLASRSCAYNGMAHWLLHTPASVSESRAIMAQDPVTLAELGLQDANKLAGIAPGNPEAFLQQGMAYMLLDNYMKAKSQLLEGLGIEPFHEGLQKTLLEVQQHLTGSRSVSPAPALASVVPTKRKARSIEDAECSLCMKLFFEPVTTPCGHSFCRNCFLRARDHKNKCPMCRCLLPVSKEIPVTAALAQIIQSSFPEEYEARRQEERALFSAQEGGEQPLPLFVMTSIFPGEEMSLNIFEPRYRLLVRRSMDGSRKLGMCTVDSSHRLPNAATEVEICECQALPDGRFHIEVKGRRRFRITRSWEQDGVRVAQPDFFQDTPPEADSTAAEALQESAKSAIKSILAVREPLERYVLGMGGTPPDMLDWVQGVAEAPTPADAEKLSFWLACLLQPFHRFDRFQLLEMTLTMERLTFLVSQLNQVVNRLDRRGNGRWECVIS